MSSPSANPEAPVTRAALMKTPDEKAESLVKKLAEKSKVANPGAAVGAGPSSGSTDLENFIPEIMETLKRIDRRVQTNESNVDRMDSHLDRLIDDLKELHLSHKELREESIANNAHLSAIGDFTAKVEDIQAFTSDHIATIKNDIVEIGKKIARGNRLVTTGLEEANKKLTTLESKILTMQSGLKVRETAVDRIHTAKADSGPAFINDY